MEYAFLDTNNVVQSVIFFEEKPDDITPFLDAQKASLGIDDLTPLEITDAIKYCGVGHVLDDETTFKPQQPYPSWLWDETKRLWMAPKIHPELLYGNNGAFWTWDEENLEWVPTRG
jgi:hypothetical protein